MAITAWVHANVIAVGRGLNVLFHQTIVKIRRAVVMEDVLQECVCAFLVIREIVAVKVCCIFFLIFLYDTSECNSLFIIEVRLFSSAVCLTLLLVTQNVFLFLEMLVKDNLFQW